MVGEGGAEEVVQVILKKLRKMIGGVPGVRAAFVLFAALNRSFGLSMAKWPSAMGWYFRDYRRLKAENESGVFKISSAYLFPCLTDNRPSTPIEPVYFFQDTWAASKVFALKPARHHDIGSSAMTMGILSQFVPVTMVDIRPVEITLDGLSFRKGSILDLPFEDGSIESLSSLCVVEHVGLGRYGDEIDARGSEKAIAELKRVLKVGGNLFLSVPVDTECRIYFNAHRAFTRDYLMQLLAGLVVVEERYQYGYSVHSAYKPELGFGTGLYHLRKAAA